MRKNFHLVEGLESIKQNLEDRVRRTWLPLDKGGVEKGGIDIKVLSVTPRFLARWRVAPFTQMVRLTGGGQEYIWGSKH